MAAIGIDLGTTYSCVGVVVDGKVEILPNRRGNYTTPSCVSFARNGFVVGEDAKMNLSEDPRNTIYNVKRVIGRRSDEPVLKAEKANLSYDIVERDGEVMIKTSVDGQGEHYFPEEISGKVLAEMKKIAEDYLGEEVVSAVITIPARFNNGQRKKTREAAEYARLNVLQLLHEPTAAAIAYGLQHEQKRDGRKVLVYDLGGGTFDVTILTITDGEFKITVTAGDVHLGGEDFDRRMAAECIKDFAKSEGIDVGNDIKAKCRLKGACEKTKIALSTLHQDNVTVRNIFADKDFSKRFTRAKFEAINDDFFTATMESVEEALRDAGLTKYQIDDIVLVGGSTRIPHVQTTLKQFFEKQVCKSLDPDQAVAYGAAILAAQLTGDVTSELRHFQIRDVIPLSLGVETKGGVMSVVVKRNTEFPTKQHEFYTTVDDFQTSIRFSVYEGERAKVELNHLLGSFTLRDIPSHLDGVPSIRVSFHIDIDGMLNVTALDRATGNENGIDIEWEKRSRNTELTRSEVIKAEKYKDEDEQWKKRIFARNTLEASARRIIRAVNTPQRQNSYSLETIKLCDDILAWLAKNQDASVDDYNEQARKLHPYRYLQ